jgi:hypothetical protein
MALESQQAPNTVIDTKRATVLYTALNLAIADVRDVLASDTKSSRPYRDAMKFQLAEYEAEQNRLAQAFPELSRDGHA